VDDPQFPNPRKPDQASNSTRKKRASKPQKTPEAHPQTQTSP
jgi:hypothetical protein